MRRKVFSLTGMPFSECPAGGWREAERCTCRKYIYRIMSGCAWDEFYDIVEILYEELAEKDDDSAERLEQEVNKLFSSTHVAYALRNGRIERLGAAIEDDATAQAKGILRDQDLAGPNERFLKAVAFFSRRPEPDLENCVKEAVGAAEGVARVLLGDSAILLNKAASDLEKQRGMHPTLRKMISDLYAYRGDAEGAAHGKSGAKPEITLADAGLVLTTSAAIIVYLARLFGRSVN